MARSFNRTRQNCGAAAAGRLRRASRGIARNISSARICVRHLRDHARTAGASVSASLKTTQEAAAVPPTYFPHRLSLDSYDRLWSYQAGLPAYLFNSSARRAADYTLLPCADRSGWLRAGSFSHPGQGAYLRLPAARPYRSLSGADDAAVLHVRAIAPDQHLSRPRRSPHGYPIPVQRLHHAQQLRSGAARARRGRGHRRLLELAGARSTFSSGIRPAIVTVSLFAFITSWNEFLGALVIMNKARPSRCR